MNDTTDLRRISAAANARIARIFAGQQAAFLKHPCPRAEVRRGQLRSLKHQVERYQDVLAEAMVQDFGYRAPAESKMLDLLGSVLELNHAISHLKRWMKSSRRSTEWLFLTNSVKVTYQPNRAVSSTALSS